MSTYDNIQSEKQERFKSLILHQFVCDAITLIQKYSETGLNRIPKTESKDIHLKLKEVREWFEDRIPTFILIKKTDDEFPF